MNLGIAQVIQGNALALPLPDSSVDLICTSPPYFGLRSYQDGCPDCANNSKANTRGYMERYCPGCNQIRNRNVCPDCGLTTLRTEATKQALRKTDCATCGGTGKGHYDGQIGSEATPAEFLDALLAATREMVRVLKPSGSIFVNLGDKYNSAASGHKGKLSHPESTGVIKWQGDYRINERGTVDSSVPVKSLMGMPWRYAIACIDQLGLILRAEIIWAKPNGLPESVTDRVRRSHEQWFHFVRQPRYFAAVDEIREPQQHGLDRVGTKNRQGDKWQDRQDGGEARFNSTERILDPRGKLPGSVWVVPTQPLSVPPELGVDHFAAYPMEWPRRIIQGWAPNGVCTGCGEGRRPTVAKDYTHRQNRFGNKFADGLAEMGTHGKNRPGSSTLPDLQLSATITGYMCGCPTPDAPATPAIVLDPFGGTGTTALVAKALGRISITIDLSADYCRLAEWRCNDPRELAAALQVEKPEPISPDQLSLFGEPA